MTATDELRRMLDERGVAHSDHYLSTTWRAGHGILHLAGEPMADGLLVVDMLTPKQAIAATVGAGTCKVESSVAIEFDTLISPDYFEFEMSCGSRFRWSDNEPPDYCPGCGRRVAHDGS